MFIAQLRNLNTGRGYPNFSTTFLCDNLAEKLGFKDFSHYLRGCHSYPKLVRERINKFKTLV